MNVAMGSKIEYQYTFMASEQGQRYPTQWTGSEKGTVVKIKGDELLVEQNDGTRKWIDKNDITGITI